MTSVALLWAADALTPEILVAQELPATAASPDRTLEPSSTLAPDPMVIAPKFDGNPPPISAESLFGPSKGLTPSSPPAVPPWVKTGIPPEGFDEFEVVDRAVGLRDDYVFLVHVDRLGRIWVGAQHGRVHLSVDRGQTWTESVVIPEQKSLYTFNDQTILLGAMRGMAHQPPGIVNLNNHTYAGDATSMLRMNGMNPAMRQGGSIFSGLQPDFGNNINPLEEMSQNELYGRGGLLGAGLSARAPRLSLLLRILKRPIANISLQRMLVDSGKRETFINRFALHPNGTMFVATAYGFYESVDDGVRWMRTFPGLTAKEREIWDIAIDPEDPNRMYIATGSGLYASTDAGRSWAKNTQVPEIKLYRVALDPSDSNYVYAAGDGGVYRSDNKGRSFIYAYFHSIPKRRHVTWLEVDPFDPNRAFLGTQDGIMRTDNLRTSTSQDWYIANSLRTATLYMTIVVPCTNHPGHWYTQSRAALPIINYETNGPENYAMESWDYYKTIRILTGNRSIGDVQWIEPEMGDTDKLWVGFSRALSMIRRKSGSDEPEEARGLPTERLFPGDPSVGEVILAALRNYDLTLDAQQHNLDLLKYRNFIPSTFNLRFEWGKLRVRSIRDEIQYPEDRYIGDLDISEWRLMAFANWSLPDIVHNGIFATPMLQYRVLLMDEEVRQTVTNRIHRNYGEYHRLKARILSRQNDDLYTRAVDQVRLEYLEAVVDLASGGYLSRRKREKVQ